MLVSVDRFDGVGKGGGILIVREGCDNNRQERASHQAPCRRVGVFRRFMQVVIACSETPARGRCKEASGGCRC
jgi:hypothetical protein